MITETKGSEVKKPLPAAPRTVAEALGQAVWLLSQSATHRELRIKDLEWSVMPAILHEQFRIFSFGPIAGADDVDAEQLRRMGLSKEGVENMPLGMALWARVSEAAEKKIEKGEHLTLQEWRSGDRWWLVELISPFANPQNKLLEGMLVDLIKGPFAKTAFNVHRTDPSTGVRERVHMNAHLPPASPAH